MKHLLSLFLLLALVAVARGELTIISTEHRDADSFKRVSEYLTGQHSDGRYTVYRSDESARDGFYISLLAEKRSSLASSQTVKVKFVRSGTQDIDTFEVPTGTPKKKRILVGFTGNEWANQKTLPVAWKIEFLDKSGTIIESAQSFLWSE